MIFVSSNVEPLRRTLQNLGQRYTLHLLPKMSKACKSIFSIICSYETTKTINGRYTATAEKSQYPH